jgi:hypothetical protein
VDLVSHFLSEGGGILEYMFEPSMPPPEVIARFDELFERHYPSTTPESAALLDRIAASWRAENRAAAASLAAIGELSISGPSRQSCIAAI